MFCRLQHHILQQFLLLSCGTTTSKMKWKSRNSNEKKRRRGASHSILEISHLSKIHFSLDPLKERSAEYHHVTDLVAEQRAFWQKKKNRHGDWAWPLPQFSSQTGVSKTRGRSRGLSFFFQRMLFQGQCYGQVQDQIQGQCQTLTLTLKQHSLKKDRPQSLVLLTLFANRFMDFYLSVHQNLGTAACAHCACGFHLQLVKPKGCR